MKFIKFISCFLLILTLIVGLGGGYLYYDYTKATTSKNTASLAFFDNKTEIPFKVESGSTFNDVIDLLKSKNLIQNDFYFKYYLRFKKIDKIDAANYMVPTQGTYSEILDALKRPVVTRITVSFPEGLRYDEIQKRINTQVSTQLKDPSKSAYNPDELISMIEKPHKLVDHDVIKIIPEGKNLEGFLFPDTYFFEQDVSAKQVITSILNNFELKFNLVKDLSGDYRGLDLTDYEKVILASIVEKEGTGQYVENANIADVFLKRLRGDLGPKHLQSDVVLLYEFKDWKHEITQSEIEDDTLTYNSHALDGLPPTPICSPGLNTLKAVYEPISNDYLFFIADLDGIVRYAKDYAEHLANVRKYLE